MIYSMLMLLNDIELRFQFHSSSLLDILFDIRKIGKKNLLKSTLIKFSLPINHILFHHFVLKFTQTKVSVKDQSSGQLKKTVPIHIMLGFFVLVFFFVVCLVFFWFFF